MTSTTDRGSPWQFGASAIPTRVMRSASRAWAGQYSRVIALSDFAVIVLATGSTHLIWFGFAEVVLSSSVSLGITYLTFSFLLVGAWMIALAIAGSRETHMLGTDFTEYRRVVN
ncbi:MAG: hypothetical protein Q8M65_11420, partial [Rhodoglobus sp.]|nr:hypothetical protein [Rhodoglobus sp.]